MLVWFLRNLKRWMYQLALKFLRQVSGHKCVGWYLLSVSFDWNLCAFLKFSLVWSFNVCYIYILFLSPAWNACTRTGTKKEVVTSKNGKSRGWDEEQQNSLNHHLIYSFVTFEEPLDLISWTAHKRALRFESKESISLEHRHTWHLVEHCYTDVQYNLKSCTIP